MKNVITFRFVLLFTLSCCVEVSSKRFVKSLRVTDHNWITSGIIGKSL